MDDLIGWGMLAIAAGTAAVGALRRIAERRRARQVLREQPELAPQVTDGTVVRVTGIVRAIEPLTAPLSGRTCVVYRSRVDSSMSILRRVAAGRGIHESIVVAPFVLDRGADASVLVDGTHALLDLRAVDLGNIDRTRREQFVLTLGLSPRDSAGARFEETILEPGAKVSVAGLLMLEPAIEASAIERHFREAPPPSLRLTGNAEHPLAIGAAAVS